MKEYKGTKYVPIEIDFEIDFCTNEAKAYTTSEFSSDSTSKKEFFLVIEVWTQLDDDVSESSENVLLYTRPSILIVLSIISYLLNHPLSAHGISGCELGNVKMLGDETEIASGDTKPNEIRVSKFVHGQVDKSGDLLIILEAVYKREESASGFVVSLLSRWHKARYLEEQGEVILYCEESFLVYFHIIELFSNYYIKEQKKEVEDQIKKFIKELSSTTLKLRDKRLEQFSEEKFKAIYPILIPNGQVPITSKICYFLDRVELLNIKTHYFIKQVVDIRNDIAHGRPVNYKTLNWPLPSFFSISGNVENFIFYIRTFTARVIGAYLSIEAWIDEWDVAYSRLDMPPEYVKKLINNDSFKSITPSDFLKGINGIKPSSLVKQFLLNKINIKEMEIGLKSFMLDVVVDKESASEIFEAAIVLADSSDERLSDRCRSIVIDIHKNKLVSYFSRENVPRNIEQQGCKLSWFRE